MSRIISNLNSSDFCFQGTTFSVRLLAEPDKALYQQLYCSKQVMQYISTPLTEPHACTSFNAALRHNHMASQSYQLGCRVFLVMADNESKQRLGLLSVSVQLITQADIGFVGKFEAELGIMLLPSAQNLGLGQAAIAGLCQKLSVQPNIYRFTFCTAAHNFAAKKLVSRLGFVYCGNGNCYQLLQ
ncbi:hypothetical protein VT06_00855 [Arsukibacterium sp. MJ3]|jgi:RimJ/RimL family protein N-acetyltransferase|uniref:GNAT family N-acetyltransferase n=1 Tax=Arsukibacterium sp. MJ3 TaxID=1632859 RepID=UPI000626F337|nr:GNAT family N-acetyltransferase [Arsukibacterium sp. MJ3]KKO50564.1 hypothetical protein VT06_00855 [Arsukibacterium sp. MJ3]